MLKTKDISEQSAQNRQLPTGAGRGQGRKEGIIQ